MSEEGGATQAVLVRSPEKFAPMAVAGVLGKRAKAPALDFVAGARRAWGLAAEGLSASDAQALAADLTAAGQDAVAVPDRLLETPPAPIGVSKAELSPEGFEILVGRANAAPERLAWSRLAAVCAASVEERSSKTVTETKPTEVAEQAVRLGLTMATGLPLMKSSSKVTRVVETRDRALVLDLLFLEPARRLRVDPRAFDFSCLGAKMTYGAESNLLALAAELTERAPRALRGKGTRALLGRRPSAESMYESLDDLAREERWLLNLVALRAAL